MTEQVFIHEGIAYATSAQMASSPALQIGMWLRLCHDPCSSKPDLIGRIISIARQWRVTTQGTIFDTDIELARGGNSNDIQAYKLEDEYFEIIVPLSGPFAADSNLPGLRRRGSMDIVVCFDGTRNENERQNTNVHRIFELLDKRYSIGSYYSGVGVGGRLVGRWLDEATGRGVFRTVRAAYTFVRGNFLQGDRIFIFGFSRGAFAARHLAGMVARIGIKHHVEAGYEKYLLTLQGSPPSKRNGGNHEVHFLGLFDCVPGNQLYLLQSRNRALNNATIEPDILNVAHAVSRDERRWSFKPLIFKSSAQDSFDQTWFPGFHSDVGGDDNPPLNDFACAWMARKAGACGLSLTEVPKGPFDPLSAGRPSDYLTTRLGIRSVRSELPCASKIGPVPVLP
jgi:hypothetical protein